MTDPRAQGALISLAEMAGEGFEELLSEFTGELFGVHLLERDARTWGAPLAASQPISQRTVTVSETWMSSGSTSMSKLPSAMFLAEASMLRFMGRASKRISPQE